VKGSSEVRRRPRYGQHFLRNARTIEKILDAVGAGAGETVVEVGPGQGALTRPLLARGIRVVAFEIDRQLHGALLAELGDRGLSLHCVDALEADVDGALRSAGAAPPVPLVGNLPYESATPMIRAFVRRPDLFSRLVTMIQKEVADRLVSPPGGEAFGFLTLDVGAHASARRLFDVSRGDFSPQPLVKSSVIELVPHAAAPDARAALAVASAGFLMRRKTLVNGLTPLWGREAAQAAIEKAGLPATVRAETLDLATFQRLAALLGPPLRSGKKQAERDGEAASAS
jgi:16S rRNA (adenine1518-N6/adenine1519-N6)-dimethyltransferase